jgi:UDP-4-amino-4,6-dideoxy-N-acetyl-beta-L-altrosamine transaminase
MTESLAIDGGTPVRDDLLPYGSQSVTEEDAEAVKEAVQHDWITQGPRIDRFEETVADCCGAQHGVAFSSGTAALHAAVRAAGIGEGDEVITTPLTFAATANAVVYEDGTPVFADIDPDTLTIDPARVKSRMTSSTRALISVDFAGHPCDYNRIHKIADEQDLTVIADAAHALGAEYRGRKTGTLADMTVFSFHPVKHITTGEGGMVLTDSETFESTLREFRHHGITKDPSKLTRPDEGPWYYEIHEPGRNYRITDIQCALGLRQMKRLEEFVGRRRDIAGIYDEQLAGIDGLIPPPESSDVRSSYHIYPVQFLQKKFEADRRQIFEALRAENIGVQVHYVPVHYHPFFRDEYGYREGAYPEAETYYHRAMSLPLFPAMTDQDIEDVITAVQKLVSSYGVTT